MDIFYAIIFGLAGVLCAFASKFAFKKRKENKMFLVLVLTAVELLGIAGYILLHI